MERFESDPHFPLSPAVIDGDFSGAELIFYEVDHSGVSYEALAFLNAPDASAETSLEQDDRFAGSFVIFGHGGCVGDEGHCDVVARTEDPFDSRPLHPLTPQTKTIDVTDALRRTDRSSGYLQVTVLPVVPSEEGPQLTDELSFSAVRLVTYD